MRPSATRPRSRTSRAVAAAVGLTALLAVIVVVVLRNSSGDDGSNARVTVSAAASLTEAFAAIRDAFETENPDIRVTVNSGSSSSLAAQIVGGAPVDVFASADQPTMARVADAGLVDGTATIFATNSLRMIVRKGNPQGIRSLGDLARTDVVYVTCSGDVPIGKYAAQVLSNAGVSVTPRSLESDVKGIVTKVATGEADAGIVYATDIAATNGAVTAIDIPASVNVVASYPIAQLRDAGNHDAARSWIDFVLSPRGRAILESFGFGAP